MKTSYQSGDLDRRIILIDPMLAPQNEYGEFEINGKGCKQVWACKEDTINRQMKEDMIGEQIVAHGQTTFVMRYCGSVEETWLVAERRTGIRYTIEGKTELGRNQWTVLHCVRKDNL